MVIVMVTLMVMVMLMVMLIVMMMVCVHLPTFIRRDCEKVCGGQHL
jgi:hypothetical protein